MTALTRDLDRNSPNVYYQCWWAVDKIQGGKGVKMKRPAVQFSLSYSDLWGLCNTTFNIQEPIA